MGGGGCTVVLFLSLCGISRARLPSHISQSDATCFPLAAIPSFPEAEVHDFCYQGGAESDFEGGEIPSKLDVQTRACCLSISKVHSSCWYYKQVILPCEEGGYLNNESQTSEAFEVYSETGKYVLTQRLKWN